MIDITFHDVTDKSLFSGGGVILGGVFSLFFFKSKIHRSYDITVFVIVIVEVNGKIHSGTHLDLILLTLIIVCILNLVYDMLFLFLTSFSLIFLSRTLFLCFFVI